MNDLPAVMPINQPSNQIKFTNVSVVRLKKGMHDGFLLEGVV